MHIASSVSSQSPLQWFACCCALLVVLGGCAQPSVPKSDVAQATQLLNQTFDAWIAGETVDAQRAKDPPVYVADELWTNGVKLKSYRIIDSGKLVGTNVRFAVTLVCTEGGGPPKERQHFYTVTTTPARTIARQDF